MELLFFIADMNYYHCKSHVEEKLSQSLVKYSSLFLFILTVALQFHEALKCCFIKRFNKAKKSHAQPLEKVHQIKPTNS